MESLSSLLLRVLFIESSPASSPVGSEVLVWSTKPLLEIALGSADEVLCPLSGMELTGEIEGAGLCFSDCR
jgi:hypothetical protein